MPTNLPQFRYHPDPVRTGMFEASSEECLCCGKSRGHIYVGPVYGEEELQEALCPWCIKDGSAAKKMGASFADDQFLLQAKLPKAVVDEVHLRTPAFFSWQSERWLAHCGDACAFLGDASAQDLAKATETTKQLWRESHKLKEEDWNHMLKGYQPRGHNAFYKFVCLHCDQILFGWDCS